MISLLEHQLQLGYQVACIHCNSHERVYIALTYEVMTILLQFLWVLEIEYLLPHHHKHQLLQLAQALATQWPL